MRLLVGTAVSSEYRRVQSQLRSQAMARNLQQRLDLRVRGIVEAMVGEVSFEPPLEAYLISQDSWDHVADLGIEPALVFCHPDMLEKEPFVSLYYRGIGGLSLKEVQIQARSVTTWERDPASRKRKPRLTSSAANDVACLYNCVTSSIIENTSNWVLENGYRTIIASLGISFDGTMRNRIGQEAEQRVRRLLLRFCDKHGLLVEPDYPSLDSPIEGGSQWRLREGVVMAFGSEPDVAFRKEGSLESTIEVKGGTDPAGALERLGAAVKSATAALADNPRCKNFLVAGVITDEMRHRLEQERLFEKYFNMVELLSDEARQREFFDEVFNHALRLTTT